MVLMVDSIDITRDELVLGKEPWKAKAKPTQKESLQEILYRFEKAVEEGSVTKEIEEAFIAKYIQDHTTTSTTKEGLGLLRQ